MAIDYTTFNNPNAQGPGYTNRRWWLLSLEERAQSVASVIEFLSKNDSRRENQYQLSSRLYGNQSLMGMRGASYSRLGEGTTTQTRERISYNVCQSTVDTVTAKMAKNKPAPLFLTSGGDWKIQRKAKKLDKFVQGVFYENDAYSLGNTIFRDSAILGDGIVYVFEENERVRFERVLPSEIYVDHIESFYGKPRQLHRVKNIDRAVLFELFPDHRRIIEGAKSSSSFMRGSYENLSDQVTVIESWHLRSGLDAKDGIHTINIETGNLFDEKYTKDFFPFAFLPWSKRIHGFWSQGLIEQIQNIQTEMNKILWIIQRSMHLGGSFKVLVENGSKIVKEHLNNDIGSIINYSGTKPEYIVPPMVPVEYYNHFQTLKGAAFEQAGISQLSASSMKPAGLNAGVALREYQDIESERFMVIAQAYEQFYLDLARLSISVAKDIYSRNKHYKVRVPGKKFIDSIDWKDIDLEDDEYTMKIFPISSLPRDPAGRLQTVTEYIQAGFLTPRTGRRLLDFPDLEAVEELQNANEDYLHMIMDKMIDEGEYTPPEPYDDLALAQELSLEYYSQGKLNNLPEERMELLRRFMDQVQALIAKAQPPQAPPQQEPQSIPAVNPAQPESRPMMAS